MKDGCWDETIAFKWNGWYSEWKVISISWWVLMMIVRLLFACSLYWSKSNFSSYGGTPCFPQPGNLRIWFKKYPKKGSYKIQINWHGNMDGSLATSREISFLFDLKVITADTYITWNLVLENPEMKRKNSFFNTITFEVPWYPPGN